MSVRLSELMARRVINDFFEGRKMYPVNFLMLAKRSLKHYGYTPEKLKELEEEGAKVRQGEKPYLGEEL